MTPNRLVALLTPLFASAAGLVAKLIAENAPGLNISAEDLTTVFVGGSLIALAPALQWLHGWQKHEEREAEIQRAVEVAAASAVPAAPALSAPIPEGFDDYEEYGDEFTEYGDEFDENSDELDEFGDEFDVSDDDLTIDLDEPAPTGG
jgi:hypothetical protein